MESGAHLDDLQADQHARLGVQRLHSLAEGSRAQEIHDLQAPGASLLANRTEHTTEDASCDVLAAAALWGGTWLSYGLDLAVNVLCNSSCSSASGPAS